MNQYKSSSELKNMAREKLSGKYGSAVLVSILPSVITTCVLFPFTMIVTMIFTVAEIINGTPLNEPLYAIVIYIISLPCSIVGGVFNAGIVLFFLNIACKKRHSISDIFFGFRWQFKKALALSAVITLLNKICLLPYEVFTFLVQNDFQLKWVIGLLFSFIIGMAIYIPISLMLSQSFYLLLDFPQYSVNQLLKQSIRIMKGHKGRLFYIQLSFIPLELLCILSFGIGFLWLYPYLYMTQALFFLDLMNPQNAFTSQQPQQV